MKLSNLKLKQTFDIFDRDGSGSIEMQELEGVLEALGIGIQKAELEEILNELDTNRDGEIDFSEFSSLSILDREEESQSEYLKQIFQQFDKNGDGYIDVAEMSSEAMSLLGRSLSDAEIIEMFRIADGDGNGQLDYDEFVGVIMAKSAELLDEESEFAQLSEYEFVKQLAANDNGRNSGYFSARDRLLPGKIARRDGTVLPVQVRHKTIQDYFDALAKSGFTTLPQIQELKVTDEHLQLDSDFFGSLADVPLHMAFNITKQQLERQPASKRTKAVIKDIVWTQMFGEADYCLQLPDAVLKEFNTALPKLQAEDITWRDYEIGDAGDLTKIRDFAHEIGDRCYETTGFALVQGLPLETFGSTYEEREEVAKLFYYMMSAEIGLVSERRGRLYDVRDRGLNVADDNVLFSATKEASGWHSDSTDKDFNPDIVGLLCLQDGAEGGILQNINALNVYYRLKQILPQTIFEELERPIVRDLIEKGFGGDSGNNWEQLRRSSGLGVQSYRLRKNSFPIFGRDRDTNQFSCRYMRYWIDSGHQKSGTAISPLLKIAINALENVMNNDETIYRIERKLRPGEIIYTNNHICLHNRTAYEEKPGAPRRHMVRVWIDFNPVWSSQRQ